MLRCNQMHLDELLAPTGHELRANARYMERMSMSSSNADVSRCRSKRWARRLLSGACCWIEP
eukprot:58922-Pyramimonas_sp.AAC.1